MDKHLDILKICCRLCGKKLVKGARKTKVQLLQEHIVKLWGQNVLLDSPGVHPQFACNSCRAICTNARYKSGQLNVKDVVVWTPHQDGNCRVCMSFPKKSKPGRKKKMQMKTKTISHQKEQEIESSTDTASQDSECDIDDDCVVFSLFMDNLRQSLERIPLSSRKYILKVLCEMEEGGDTESVVKSSLALPVSEQIIVVSSLLNSSNREELIKGVICTLSADSQHILAYNLLHGQFDNVLQDTRSFCQTYKNIDIIKDIDREAWLQRRNKVITAVVDGISDPKTSHLQKCLAVEHLYFLACGDQFVLPFSFLVNLLLFTITNSKLVLSVVSKILPGGNYKTVTGWRDSLASVPLPFPSGDCVTAFDNDQIVQRKWKVKVGQKARVSILTSICQAVVDEGGSLQKREDLAPR